MAVPLATGPVSPNPDSAHAYRYKSALFQADLDANACWVAAEKYRGSNYAGQRFSTKYASSVHFIFKTYEEGRAIREQMRRLDPSAEAEFVQIKDVEIDVMGYCFGAAKAQTRIGITKQDVEKTIQLEQRLLLTPSRQTHEQWRQDHRNPQLVTEIQQNGIDLLRSLTHALDKQQPVAAISHHITRCEPTG